MNTEKKLQYEEPKMSIVVFETADIITTSGNGFEGDEDSLLPDGDRQNYVWGLM